MMKRKVCLLIFVLSCFIGMKTGYASEDLIRESDLFEAQALQQGEDEARARLGEEPLTSDKEEVVTPGKKGRAFSLRGKKLGSWSWRDGVICVTDSHAKSPLFNNGHAGIVAAAPYYDSTIEANPSGGVQSIKGSWEVRFAKNTVVQLGVKATTVAQDRKAAQWATNHIGNPYNHNFGNITTRGSFYCSQLVWAAYKDTAGVDIGTAAWGSVIHPFELVNHKTSVIFRNRTS